MFKNREIKFRVWNLKKEKYTYPEDNVYSIFWNHYMSRNEVIDGCEAHYNESTHIIQQFTGLLDKNKKEIYEGDILTQTENEENITYAVVEYSTENAAFELIFINGKMNFYYFDDFKYEIVGNIFENPELLKNKLN